MEFVHKVFAYITHGNRLLVFDHVDFPEDAPQVPAGTRPEDEEPETAVLREAREETGLDSLKIASFLGEIDFSWTGVDKVFRRRFYHLVCLDTPAERWQHYEEHPSEGPPDPILFELYWVDLPDGVPELSPGHDAFLQQLLVRMKLT
jgi:8-oxo-dGTP pyrophosphatase MutT (NUDIX family)